MTSRCSTRGCPVRYRSGPDRPCSQHQTDDGDTLAARMAAFTEMAAAPGEHASADGSDRGDGAQ